MTALKPIENRRVVGVASERYPLNKVCAHPECSAPAVDPHHVFPRSMIGNDSWFVAIEQDDNENEPVVVLPHVAGLCREHHDLVEDHRAWIKLEDDGEFVWYDRPAKRRKAFEVVGALNPQPGSREGKPKKKKRKKGEERRMRATWTIRVPDRDEDEPLLEDLTARLEERIQADAGENAAPARSPYFTLVDAVNYTLLNEYGVS